MARATVVSVIDGDTFRISPNWSFGGQTGDKIRVAGIEAPEINEPGGSEAKQKLEQLILGKQVEYKPIKLSFDRLLASVYLNGVDISTLL